MSNNTTVINNIRDIHQRWDRNDHGYHWHDWNGHRLSHHYDTFGFHWYGWHVGDSYFWTRYHEGRTHHRSQRGSLAVRHREGS